MTLTAVSLMSAGAISTHRAICALLAARLDMELAFVDDRPWREQAAMLERGEAQLGFICGLQYVGWAERLAPLAAPAMAAPRYGGRPVYFADVVARADGPFRAFADLRGARWAYNEPGSLSGHIMALAHLASLGERGGFFGSARESGAHLESLRLVLAGEVDAAAIDSTVLDHERRARPALAGALRTLETLGPYPAPPLVAARALPAELRGRIAAAAAQMHRDAAGRAILAAGMIDRLVAVADADYDPVRRAACAAEGGREGQGGQGPP